MKRGDKISKTALAMNITIRRVQQVNKKYLDTGKIPMFTKERRPKTNLSDVHKQPIVENR